MILVFWGHFEVLFRRLLVSGSVNDQIVGFFAVWGHRGVSFFFVITGYFVYSAFMDRQTAYAPFVRKRLYRVLPLYWFMLALYLALSLAFPGESKLPLNTRDAIVYVAQNALLLQGFIDKPIMVVSWAISYLVLAYLALPGLVNVGRLRTWSPWQRVILIFAGAGIWLTACRALPFLSPRPVVLAVGLLVYEAIQTGTFRRCLTAFGEALAAGLFVLSLVAWYASNQHLLALPIECRYLFLGAGLFATCLCIIVYDGTLRKLCEGRWITQLGRRGYSYYLIHGLALKGILTLVTALGLSARKSPAGFWVLLPVSFLATLWTSALLHRYVELPLARVLNRDTARIRGNTALSSSPVSA